MSKNSQSTTPSSVQESPGFEQALSELEAIVSQMESGQLPLEQSLAAYKRGTELLQSCQKSLATIEQQIQILNEAGKLQPYTDQDE
jgi:exodeoxyribonuclease VII small subunit